MLLIEVVLILFYGKTEWLKFKVPSLGKGGLKNRIFSMVSYPFELKFWNPVEEMTGICVAVIGY